MANIDITVNTLTSALTPPGGSATDDYWVSSSAVLTIDSTIFLFNGLNIGKHSGGTESAGSFKCRGGKTCTGGPINIYNLGEVKDDTTSDPSPSSPITFQGTTAVPNQKIHLYKSGAKWSVRFYLLNKPNVMFGLFQDLTPGPDTPLIDFSLYVDVLSDRENMGGSRFERQTRYGKRPRFFPIGKEGREVVLELAFNSAASAELGFWRNCTILADKEQIGWLITPNTVWPRMRFVDTGEIEQNWSMKNFQLRFKARFVEDEV